MPSQRNNGQLDRRNLKLESGMDTVRNVIQIIRKIRQTYRVPSAQLPQVTISCVNRDLFTGLSHNVAVIEKLAKCCGVSIVPGDIQTLHGNLSQTASGQEVKVFVKIKGLINVDEQYQSLVDKRTFLQSKIAAINLGKIKGLNAKTEAEAKLDKLQASVDDVNNLMAELEKLK